MDNKQLNTMYLEDLYMTDEYWRMQMESAQDSLQLLDILRGYIIETNGRGTVTRVQWDYLFDLVQRNKNETA